MANPSADIVTNSRERSTLSIPIAAGVTFYRGEMVPVNAAGYATKTSPVKVMGYVVPENNSTDLDNSGGGAGDKTLQSRVNRAAYFEVSAVNPPTIADIGNMVYCEDTQTISRSPDNGYGLPVGILEGIDGTKAIVNLQVSGAALTASPSNSGSTVASTQDLIAGTGPVFNVNQTVYPVAGDGGPQTLPASDMPAPAYDGQIVYLRGTHDTNIVTFQAGAKLMTEGAIDLVLPDNSIAMLMGVGAGWQVVSHAIVKAS